MARIIGTTGSAPAAKPKVIKVKAHTRTIKPKAQPRYKVPASPDRNQAADFAKANAYKRTPAYKRIVRQSYTEQSLPQRRADARAAERVPAKNRTTEQKQVARVHGRRHAVDVAQLHRLGFLPRVRYNDTGSVLPSNRMPDDSAALAKKLHWSPAQYRANKAVLEHNAIGFKPEGVLDKAIALPALVVPGAVKSAGALAEATYHDPIGVPTKTAKQLALATAAVIPGTVHLAMHPAHDSAAIVDSMYQNYAEPYDKKVKRIRKEGGLQDAINVATLLGPTSKALALGKFGTIERAGLRVSGGLVKDRAPRAGLLSGLAGKAIDTQKGKRYERLAAKGKELTGQQHAALQANREAGRVVEVVPNRVRGRVVRDVAKVRGQAVNALHYDLSKGDFGQAAKKLNTLDKNEKKALWFAAAGGVRTADQARELLPKLKEKILLDRKDAPKGRYRKMDMVQRINDVLANPEQHFTPHLDETLNSIQPHLDAISARDPRYAALTKETRRRADQNVLLGLAPGEGHDVPGHAPVVPQGPLESPYVRTNGSSKTYNVVNEPPFTHDYQPSAAGINAKTFYHGTNHGDLKLSDLDGTQTQSANLFGQGVYLTDDRATAAKYAAARSRRGGIPTVYAAKLHIKNPLDMEAPLHPKFAAEIQRAAAEVTRLTGGETDVADEVAAAISRKGVTNSDLYDAFRRAVADASQSYEIPASEFTETFQNLASNLRAGGFDALTHVGGGRVGDHAHQVTILLDPANTGSLEGVSHQAEAFTPHRADAVSFTAGHYANAPRVRRGPKGDVIPAIPPLHYAPETDAQFVARGDQAAAAAGLRKPMYFKAERHRGEQADHSAFAVGGGSGAMALEGKHEGRNLSKGILDMSDRAFLRGYARNVKAAHNWPLVEKLVNRHAYNDLTPGPGLDVSHALDAINQATPEIKPGDVALFNPGIFRKHLEEHTDQTAGTEGLPEDQSAANIVDAMNASKIEAGQGVPSRLAKTSGWKAVPTSMLRELEAEMKAGTRGGRVLDIAKGKASRAILLTANVPWLAIQAVSEGGVAGLASKGAALNPVNWLGTRQWWKGMSHEQRQEVSSVLGLNSTAADLRQTRLGAVSTGGFVNSYRAMKEAPIWHKDRKWLANHGVSELNPAELMAAADRGKTNVTRLLLAHSHLKKAAVEDMAKNLSHLDKATTKLMSVFQRPVHEQYAMLRKDPHLLEHVGEKVVDWLGDWTTMTAAERKAARFVMFYPYVRYATRLLFYTLPVHHPIVTTALAEIGQLTQQEYRQVFGDDDLPWNIGKIYFGKVGESKYIDLSRANPLMTGPLGALSRLGTHSSNVPGAIVGTLPPYGQWMVDQLTGVNTFSGRALRLHGSTDPRYIKPWQIGLADHAKLSIAEVQSLFYPAREAMNRLHPETQSDESSLLFPTPMKYKKASEITGGGKQNTIRRLTAKNAEADQAFNRQHDGGLAGLVLGPLLPTPSRDAASSKNRQYISKLQAEADKVAAQRKAYRDSHGGKNPTKPKTPFGGSSHKPFSGSGHKVFSG